MANRSRRHLIHLGEKIHRQAETILKEEVTYCGMSIERIRCIVTTEFLDSVTLYSKWLRNENLPVKLVCRGNSPACYAIKLITSYKRFARTPLGVDLLQICRKIDEFWNTGTRNAPQQFAPDLKEQTSSAEEVWLSNTSYLGLSRHYLHEHLEATLVHLKLCLEWLQTGSVSPLTVFSTIDYPGTWFLVFSKTDMGYEETPIGKDMDEFLLGVCREMREHGIQDLRPDEALQRSLWPTK